MITSQFCPGLPPPPVFAGEQDVGPSKRGDMREQSGVAIQPGPLPRGNGGAKLGHGSGEIVSLRAE